MQAELKAAPQPVLNQLSNDTSFPSTNAGGSLQSERVGTSSEPGPPVSGSVSATMLYFPHL